MTPTCVDARIVDDGIVSISFSDGSASAFSAQELVGLVHFRETPEVSAVPLRNTTESERLRRLETSCAQSPRPSSRADVSDETRSVIIAKFRPLFLRR